MNAAFSSDECNLLEQALDVAWDIVLHSGKLDAFKLETARAALTRAILTSYESGERNVRRLAISAVAQIEIYAARVPPASPQTQTPAA